jgi:hypothetical protein
MWLNGNQTNVSSIISVLVMRDDDIKVSLCCIMLFLTEIKEKELIGLIVLNILIFLDRLAVKSTRNVENISLLCFILSFDNWTHINQHWTLPYTSL